MVEFILPKDKPWPPHARIHWTKRHGDPVNENERVAYVEAPHYASAVTSTTAGTFGETFVREGEEIKPGLAIFTLMTSEEKIHERRIADIEILASNEGLEERMSHVSREEMSARLEAVESRTETRFVSIESKLDKLSDVMLEMRSDNRNTRITIIITVITATIAGVGVILATQASLLTAFFAGVSAGG